MEQLQYIAEIAKRAAQRKAPRRLPRTSGGGESRTGGAVSGASRRRGQYRNRWRSFEMLATGRPPHCTPYKQFYRAAQWFHRMKRKGLLPPPYGELALTMAGAEGFSGGAQAQEVDAGWNGTAGTGADRRQGPAPRRAAGPVAAGERGTDTITGPQAEGGTAARRRSGRTMNAEQPSRRYYGVTRHGKKWLAKFRFKGKDLNLGHYEEAGNWPRGLPTSPDTCALDSTRRCGTTMLGGQTVCRSLKTSIQGHS